METNNSVGFIGAGNMAFALAKGMKSRFPSIRFFYTDPVAERIALFRNEIDGDGSCGSVEEVSLKAGILFLCVKPQMKEAVLPSLAAADKPVVSIMAGVPLSLLTAAMPKAAVVRVMPNTGCLAGEMAAAFSCGASVTAAVRGEVRALLNAAGTAVEVDESLLDAVTGLSGSGPAFVARLLQYFTDAGEAAGLPRDVASALIRKTFLGTVRLLDETGIDEETLIKMVSSPGGTTVAGRNVLENSDAARIITETVAAATERSRELGKA